jgi:hypothetical protein
MIIIQRQVSRALGWTKRRLRAVRYGICGALLVGALVGCAGCGGSTPTPQNAYHVEYPTSWARQSNLPHSAYLSSLAIGHSSTPGCPNPLSLVRGQANPHGSLKAAVQLYNRYEQSRRPGRKVFLEKPVSIRGAKAAVLLESTYPAKSGKVIRSFDLLALSDSNVAFHLFASGCGSDLPANFVKHYILTFNADTLK